jgi:hypothetical protein
VFGEQVEEIAAAEKFQGLPSANSNAAFPYPLVETRIPFEAPSLWTVPKRSRTALTPTVFLYLFA